MHKFQIEVAASLIRAENNAHTDMIKSIKAFKELETHQERFGAENLLPSEVLVDLIAFTLEREKLPLLFLDLKQHKQRLVIISNPMFISQLLFEIEEQNLGLVLNSTISSYDSRFNKLAVLAIEAEGSMGNGYVVLRAWENVVVPSPPLGQINL